MNSRTFTAVLLWAAFGFTMELSAQSAEAPLRLTLGEAVERAIALSEEVETARTALALADSQITQVRADALPQVSASVGYTRTLATVFDFPGLRDDDVAEGLASLPFGQPNIWIASLQVSQPIYAGGRLGVARDIAENILRGAEHEVTEAEEEITLQVRTAYFQTVLADDLVEIAEEAHRLADEHLRQVELFRQQGAASDFDVLRARVERDNLEPAIVEARNARRVAELELKRLINVPVDRSLETSTPIEPVIGELDRDALRASVGGRAGLRALDEELAARASNVRIAESARRPDVSFVGSFSFQSFPVHVIPVTNWRRDWSVGLQLSVPLFDGGRIRGQVRQANAEVRQTQLQRAQFREGLDLELEAALGEFDSARAMIAARRATVEEAQRAMQLAELRFQNGLATQLEISDARLLLQQAQINEVQSLSAYITALAQIERVTGGAIPLVTPRLPAGGE